jgi:hypothetical protein
MALRISGFMGADYVALSGIVRHCHCFFVSDPPGQNSAAGPGQIPAKGVDLIIEGIVRKIVEKVHPEIGPNGFHGDPEPLGVSVWIVARELALVDVTADGAFVDLDDHGDLPEGEQVRTNGKGGHGDTTSRKINIDGQDGQDAS